VHRISELDAKILGILLKDGRIGYDELAQKLNEPKIKIWKRCDAMEKKGIITGSTIQMNFALFGYDALATLLISVEAQQLDQTMNFIEKITEVHAYRQYNSVYNVRAVATLKDLNQLDYVKQVIWQKLPTIGLKTYIWTAVRNMPENLNLTGTPSQKEPIRLSPAEKSITKFEIDDLDQQIVRILIINGRTSFRKIAKETGLSTNTVLKRYHRLRHKDAIKVSIQINANKLGYTSILDFNIAFTTPRLSEDIVESLSKIPDVIVITKTSGDYDLQVTTMIKDIEQAFTLQDQISRVPGITKMEVSARKIPVNWPTPMQYISTM
jgi:DNA-binding Lrp family transcriptional regulator